MPDDQTPNSLPPTQSASLEAGQRVFRQYVLHRFLGRGALGAAWRVVHEGHGRELAMRFVPEVWLRDERIMAALRDAVVKLLDITHPNLIGVLDFVRDQTAAAIVAHFVEGQTLDHRRADAPERFLPIAQLQPWLSDLCEALDFCWRQHGAIHGDLCPQNLLITPGNDLRVIDFGVARNLYEVPGPTGSPLLTGTQAFVSPERARNSHVSVADDVYGFGATVYEVLTSRPVFFRGNLLWQLESVVPPAMSERRAEFGITGDPIPPEWEKVIAACLSKNKEDRPRDIREVGERLGLISPLGAAGAMPTPTVLPRPQDTSPPVRVSRPYSLSADDMSSSQVTIPMEAPTMIGRSEPEPAPAPPSAAPAPAPKPIPDEGQTIAADVAAHPHHLDPAAQFTAYRPESVMPGAWMPLILFAHVSERPPEAPLGSVQPQKEPSLPASARGPVPPDFFLSAGNGVIPRDEVVTVIPEVPGIEFFPPRQLFKWSELVQKTEFRFRAPASLAGKKIEGHLHIFAGALAQASVPVPIEVIQPGGTRSATYDRTSARKFPTVFACYSPDDTAIAQQCERFAQHAEDACLKEVTTLRKSAGSSDELAKHIQDAGVFQLFWSPNLAKSADLKKEWEQAVKLKRPDFILPIFWNPAARGTAPAELNPASFRWIGSGDAQKAFAPTPPAPAPAAPTPPPVPAPAPAPVVPAAPVEDDEADMTMVGVPSPLAKPAVAAKASSESFPDEGQTIIADVVARPHHLDPTAQFTAYRPESVLPGGWLPLVVFAHVSERPPEPPLGSVQPQKEPSLPASAKVPISPDFYQTTGAGGSIPRDDVVTVIPEVPGVEFFPPRQMFRWTDLIQKTEFRFRAPASLAGKVIDGQITIFAGTVAQASVAMPIEVIQPGGTRSATYDRVSARKFQTVFACYSPEDTAVAQQCERFAEHAEDACLTEVTKLRKKPGSSEELVKHIQDAGVFQLFWTANLAKSADLKSEWQQAVALKRPDFVIPTYWDASVLDGPAAPSPELTNLLFRWIGPDSGQPAAPAATPTAAPIPASPKPEPAPAPAAPKAAPFVPPPPPKPAVVDESEITVAELPPPPAKTAPTPPPAKPAPVAAPPPVKPDVAASVQTTATRPAPSVDEAEMTVAAVPPPPAPAKATPPPMPAAEPPPARPPAAPPPMPTAATPTTAAPVPAAAAAAAAPPPLPPPTAKPAAPAPAPSPTAPPPAPAKPPIAEVPTAKPPPVPAPQPVAAQTTPPTVKPPPIAPAPTPASPAPIAARNLVVPLAIVAVLVLAVGGGGAFMFLNRGKDKNPKELPTPAPIDNPTKVPPPTPVVKPTPVPTPPTPIPPVVPTQAGRGITIADASTMASKPLPKEKLFLTGGFRVSTGLGDIITLRPVAADMRNKVRVTAQLPRGVRAPAEGAVVEWTAADRFQVKDLRLGGDGQLNINVEKVP